MISYPPLSVSVMMLDRQHWLGYFYTYGHITDERNKMVIKINLVLIAIAIFMLGVCHLCMRIR